MMRNRQTVCIDFDGVILRQGVRWVNAAQIIGTVMPGAREAIEGLRQTFTIIVCSARCAHPGATKAIQSWLNSNGITVDGVQAEKPGACAYIDDRAVCFTGDWTATINSTLQLAANERARTKARRLMN